MKIKCRLVEAEQIISEMEERLIDVADDIAETEEGYTADCQWLVGISATAIYSFTKEFYVTGMKRSRCSCRMWQ